MSDRLIHPTGWSEYLRYATHQRGADWRPPLVTFAVARIQQAAESLTLRQLGLFMCFVSGYAECPLLDPEAGHRSARRFVDRAATWKRRVGHTVTSDDKDAWSKAGLVEFATVEEPPSDDPPPADERPELERGQERDLGRERDREVEREPEPGQDHELEREHEPERDPDLEQERLKPKLKSARQQPRRSSTANSASDGVVCGECGQRHSDGLPGDPRNPFACEINAVMDGHSLVEINAFREAAGKTPWEWDEQPTQARRIR